MKTSVFFSVLLQIMIVKNWERTDSELMFNNRLEYMKTKSSRRKLPFQIWKGQGVTTKWPLSEEKNVLASYKTDISIRRKQPYRDWNGKRKEGTFKQLFDILNRIITSELRKKLKIKTKHQRQMKNVSETRRGVLIH